MNNKERYQQAFAHVHSSAEIRYETYAGRKRRVPRPAVVLAVLALLLTGTAAAVIALSTMRLPATFPNLAEYNARIYGVDPFQVSIQLPEGCTLSTDYLDPVHADAGFSPVEVQMDGRAVGVMDYNIFELYPDGPAIHEPGFYRMVYNQLMLQVQGNWDNDYTVVRQDDVSENALTKIAIIQDYGNGRSDNPVTYRPGILAYNTDLMVYVNIWFEEGVFTQQELEDMAVSVRLSR